MDEETGFANISWKEDPDEGGAAASAGNQANASASKPTVVNNAASQEQVKGTKITCSVTKPQKEQDGTKDAFISFAVVTDTDYPTFQNPHVEVRRRFTDFLFLYRTLRREFPSCAVPPLPEKHKMAEYIKGDRFSDEFTVRRASSLDRFLTRLTFHPVLRRTSLLTIFLESNDWNAHMRTRPTRGGAISSTESGVLESFGDAFLNAFSKVHKPDKRFTEVKEKADKLDEDLSHIEKIFTKLTRRQALLEQDYADMHTHVSKMATVESSLESVFNTFGLGLEVTKQGIHELREQSDVHYLSSLRDMGSYITSVKALLKNRDQKQLDFEALTEYLARAVSERDSLVAGGGGGFIRNKVEDIRGVNHEQSRKNRARKLEHKIDELRLESEEARKLSEAFDEEVVREMSEFDRIKALEMKKTMGEMADAHIKMYQHIINEWGRIIPEIASAPKSAQDTD